MNDLIKNILPWIGTALGGPLGGIAAKFVGDKLGLPEATVSNVTAVLSGMSPEKLVELKTADHEFELKMVELGYDSIYKLAALDAAVIAEVNTTMRAESTSEHWPSYAWRPSIGFSFAAYITSLWLLPLFHIVPVPLSPEIVMAIGGILGVASWFRGKAQADVNNPISKG